MSGRGLLPFRVSTDFNLALFLKNEKSALKIRRAGESSSASNSGGVSGGASGTFSPGGGGDVRFKQVDEYVTHEYWSLDMEFLLSCFVPILWSISGIYMLGIIMPTPCKSLHACLFNLSEVLFIANIVTEFVVITGLIFAKYSPDWHTKINLLNGAIGAKLLLTAANFIFATCAISTHSCGTRYSTQLNAYAGEAMAGFAANVSDNLQDGGGQQAGETSAAIINGFRYYDTKIVGVNQVFASVGQCVAAMLLLVKRNDIKMYALWRLGKLDEYIDDTHN